MTDDEHERATDIFNDLWDELRAVVERKLRHEPPVIQEYLYQKLIDDMRYWP